MAASAVLLLTAAPLALAFGPGPQPGDLINTFSSCSVDASNAQCECSPQSNGRACNAAALAGTRARLLRCTPAHATVNADTILTACLCAPPPSPALAHAHAHAHERTRTHGGTRTPPPTRTSIRARRHGDVSVGCVAGHSTHVPDIGKPARTPRSRAKAVLSAGT